LNEVRKFAERLVKSGAVMVLPGERVHWRAVARLSWRGRNCVSWFAAGGHDQTTPHRLTFDDIRGVTKHGVCFLRGDHVVAYLSTAESTQPRTRALFAPVVPDRLHG
jgi:hypothetical protein